METLKLGNKLKVIVGDEVVTGIPSLPEVLDLISIEKKRKNAHKTFDCFGISFVEVNELPANAMQTFVEMVEIFTRTSSGRMLKKILKEKYKYIGGGHCGFVFELTDDLVIKFETGNYGGDAKDGEALHALQGLPFVPKLYVYNAGEQITVMQKIKGWDFSELDSDHTVTFTNINLSGIVEQLDDWNLKCNEKGVSPSDLHEGNMMLDVDGNFWFIDFGCFKVLDEFDKQVLVEKRKHGLLKNSNIGQSKHILSEYERKVEKKRFEYYGLVELITKGEEIECPF